jgi:hypothetical protein
MAVGQDVGEEQRHDGPEQIFGDSACVPDLLTTNTNQ